MSHANPGDGRRRFLTEALPAGALFCLGCRGLTAAVQKPGYLEDSGMTAEAVFRFSYEYLVPVLESMGKDVGREKLLELLKKGAAERYSRMVTAMAKGYPSRDLKSFVKMMDAMMAAVPIYRKAFAYEVTELTDTVCETKYTVCLPAKLLREMSEADIGYALECSSSDPMVKAFDPRMSSSFLKNMMKGDSVCIERIVLAA
ncbi:MAG: L-2-amino-thiazoline-4-carboxylic acid hydrolase [Acidobacteriota bacterium]